MPWVWSETGLCVYRQEAEYLTASYIAIEMTSLGHKYLSILMQDFWQDIEHHVWISREQSKKGEGTEDWPGLFEDRRRTFGEGRGPEISRVFLIFLILLACQCYRREREWRRETSGDECMRYDEIRNEGGGEKRQDELLMAQQVWSSLGNTGAREEGRSPICKGQREGQCVCTDIYHMCVAGAHRASCSTTHNCSPLWALQSMSQLPIHMTARTHSLHMCTSSVKTMARQAVSPWDA